MRPRGQGKPRTGEGLEEAPEETVVSEDGNPRGHFQAAVRLPGCVLFSRTFGCFSKGAASGLGLCGLTW